MTIMFSMLAVVYTYSNISNTMESAERDNVSDDVCVFFNKYVPFFFSILYNYMEEMFTERIPLHLIDSRNRRAYDYFLNPLFPYEAFFSSSCMLVVV